MNEYELYTRIIAPRFQSEKQNILTEEKAKKKHEISVVAMGVKDYTLYRFEMDEEKFLPFFNDTHGNENVKAEYPAPKALSSFCDYILLASLAGKLYVLLIEMKSGAANGAGVQLKATETFMNYIKETALRIKGYNGYDSVDGNNIVVRRIIAKAAPTARPTTNVAKRKIDWKADPLIWSNNVFPIAKICNLRR